MFAVIVVYIIAVSTFCMNISEHNWDFSEGFPPKNCLNFSLLFSRNWPIMAVLGAQIQDKYLVAHLLTNLVSSL